MSPDETLISLALAGDEEAIDQLVEKLTPVIQASIVRTLRECRGGTLDSSQRAEIEDWTQDIFLELFRNDGAVLRSWDPVKSSLRHYVGTITRRRTISRLRPKSVEESSLEEPEAGELKSSEPGPELRTASRELLRCVARRMLNERSEKARTMFKLLFVWDGSVQEVSAETGMEAATVRQWSHRLRDRAREHANHCHSRGRQ